MAKKHIKLFNTHYKMFVLLLFMYIIRNIKRLLVLSAIGYNTVVERFEVIQRSIFPADKKKLRQHNQMKQTNVQINPCVFIALIDGSA